MRLAALAVFTLATSAVAGPIFVTGHDPDFHAQDDAGAQNLLRKTLGFVRSNSAFPGKPMLWVESRIPIWSGHRRGRDGLAAIGLIEGSDYVWMDASQLRGLNWSALLDNYSVVAAASDFGGMFSQDELDVLNAHKADLATFFNNGGGIYALSEGNEGGDLTPRGGEFQFIPLTITSESSANPPYRVADYGRTFFSLADPDVSSPSHSHFSASSGLNIVSWDALNHIMSLAGFAKIVPGSGGGTSFVEGPVGQWLFEGNGNDASGGGRNLTLVGAPGFAPGLFGQALDLHRNPAQYAIRPASDALYGFGAGEFTVQTWVNFYDTSSEQTLIEKFDGATGPGWTLTKLVDNRMHFWARPGAVLYSPVQTIATGVWHHVLVRRLGNRFELFFDGRVIAQADNSNPVPPTTAPLLIGKRNAADGRDFSVNGRLDEVAIWARGLTDGEIAYLYAGGAGRTVDAHSVVVAGNSTLDKFPNGDLIPSGTQITTQLQESAAATFSSTSGGAVIINSAEASSPPSIMVGANRGTADSFQPITIDIVDPVTGAPRTATEVFVNLINVGDAQVTATAYSATSVQLDQVAVQNPGTGVGLNNVNPVTLIGNGIAKVVIGITKPYPGDGFGIDDLYIVLASPRRPAPVVSIALDPTGAADGDSISFDVQACPPDTDVNVYDGDPGAQANPIATINSGAGAGAGGAAHFMVPLLSGAHSLSFSIGATGTGTESFRTAPTSLMLYPPAPAISLQPPSLSNAAEIDGSSSRGSTVIAVDEQDESPTEVVPVDAAGHFRHLVVKRSCHKRPSCHRHRIHYHQRRPGVGGVPVTSRRTADTPDFYIWDDEPGALIVTPADASRTETYLPPLAVRYLGAEAAEVELPPAVFALGPIVSATFTLDGGERYDTAPVQTGPIYSGPAAAAPARLDLTMATPGLHNLLVAAKDNLGNADAVPAASTFNYAPSIDTDIALTSKLLAPLVVDCGEHDGEHHEEAEEHDQGRGGDDHHDGDHHDGDEDLPPACRDPHLSPARYRFLLGRQEKAKKLLAQAPASEDPEKLQRRAVKELWDYSNALLRDAKKTRVPQAIATVLVADVRYLIDQLGGPPKCGDDDFDGECHDRDGDRHGGDYHGDDQLSSRSED